MASLVVVAVRDSALNAFARPMCVPTTGIGIRSFMDEYKRDGSELSKHPGDYSLWMLGMFVEETGKFVQEDDMPRQLVRAADLKQE